MNDKVSIIILNWNEPNLTIRCLESCLQLNYNNFDIIIIDNASEDDSATILKSQYPQITQLRNDKNEGYAGGNNIGIRYAMDKGSDYLWILNNDIIVEPNSLKNLIEFYQKNDHAYALSPKVLQFPNIDILSYAGGFIDENKFISVNIGEGEHDHGQYNNPNQVTFIPGCSIFTTKSTIEKIGYFPEDYFLYFEETEWCFNISKKGGKMYYVPNSTVYHELSSTTKKTKGMSGYYAARNKLFFIERNFGERNFFIFLSISILDILSAFKKFNLRRAYNTLIAFFAWCSGNMGPIHNPKKIGLAFKRLNKL